MADEIFDQMVDALLNDVGSLGYDVSLSKRESPLRGLCLADLSNGGRGIRNQVKRISSIRSHAPCSIAARKRTQIRDPGDHDWRID